MKSNGLISKLAATACALAFVAVPSVALAQTATAESAPIVAQGVACDYTDSILIAIADSGYAPFEAIVADLDAYVNEYGIMVDYVAFDISGMRFEYEIDSFDGTIWYKDVFAI